jgi:hypothetical protein
MGIGIPGPEAKAMLVEAVRTAARMANWKVVLFEIVDM